jgi:predicted transcriptional regulator
MTDKPFVFSIRAEYARRILDGSKRFEFRKSMPGGRDRSRFTMGDTALIYESRGRGRIVARFTVGSMVHAMSPGAIWRTVETMDPGSHGIDLPAFRRYFEGRDSAVAFGVEDVIPLDLALPACMSPPQSWARWKGPWPLE